MVMGVMVLWASGPSARTWTIRADGSGDAPTIQAGIDSSANADTVLVLPGTYSESLHITGKPQLVLRGYLADQTIIDAQQSDRALWLDGGVVSGLTIRNGYIATEGAGVHLEARAPVFIQDCIIEDNTCTGFESEGGGLFVASVDNTVVTIHSSIIRNNVAWAGAAVFCRGITSLHGNTITSNEGADAIDVTGSVTMEGNLIAANALEIQVIGVWATGLTTLRSNTIVNNSVAVGGSLRATAINVLADDGPITIEQNIIAWNRSTWPGGGQQPAIMTGGNPTLRCNVLWMNEVDSIVCSCDTTGSSTRLVDPLFCDRANGDYRLRLDSPCAPIPWACPLVGAYPPVCPATTVRKVTWTDMKQLYR